MNEAASELILAWRGLQTKRPPYVLKGDETIRKEKLCHPYRNFGDYIKAPEFGTESAKKLHTGLYPTPYSGNVLKAKIYILTLNPGFSPLDYYAESYDSATRKKRIRDLKQRNFDPDYPWPSLNPKFCWSGGWRYWAARIKEVAMALSKQRGIRFPDAMKRLSKRIACLEYVPYHSKSYGLSQATVKKMRSLKLMFDFVHGYVVPKAKKGKAIIIVMRHVNMWNLPRHPNIIKYKGSQALGASLSLKSPGGKKIAKVLGIK